jgi:nucleotide-binding universal stress UspA family protein
MLIIQTILHPTDFSASANYAFQLACVLARDHGSRLVVTHVMPPPQIGREFGYEETADSAEMLRPEPAVKEKLRDQLLTLRPVEDTVPVEHCLCEGDTPAEILRLAAKCKCDLIVMGTHGRTGLSRQLLGSVAEAVQRMASCPVLTVKTPVQESATLTSVPAQPTACLSGRSLSAFGSAATTASN